MKRIQIILAGALLGAMLLVSSAQAGEGRAITWWSIEGGGGQSAGGGYTLTGTIGQADAGPVAGGSSTLNGGFWAIALERIQIFLPLIDR
jgi:hypothetical protein